jgi:myosin heavy subunit
MSVNPYKPIIVTANNVTSSDTLTGDLYSEERMMKYATNDAQSLPCHLFQVADRAYTSLLGSTTSHSATSTNIVQEHLEEEDPFFTMKNKTGMQLQVKNQSIIISGESGAGKTEATKKIMQYLARVHKHTLNEEVKERTARIDCSSLEDRVLSTNPLLESFGNARTLKNDNSSRFGKFIKIMIDAGSGSKRGEIVGASISNYLLEKTRIVQQTEGERNYHIFYQLFSGATDETLARFKLDAVENFRYLGNRATLKSRRDAASFEETMKCLTKIGLDDDNRKEVLAIISAVLHFGNIDFEKEGESENAIMTEASANSLKIACELFGLEEEKVSEAMLTKLLTVGGKTIHKPQDVAQARDKRDAFAKLAYSNLFLWLVNRINDTLASEDAMLKKEDLEFSPPPKPVTGIRPTGFIGVLDIYGFESFEVNGFEQRKSINFAVLEFIIIKLLLKKNVFFLA